MPAPRPIATRASRQPRPAGTFWRAAALALALSLTAPALLAADGRDEETLIERDRRLIADALANMTPQRPGTRDLYVLGFAGDGHEDVFRNEVLFLEQLAASRFDAGGRSLMLVNHPDSLEKVPRPLASLANLELALAGIGARMDPDEDLLLLFITTHGTPEHELVAELPPAVDEGITPEQLREVLDASGIRNRLVVVSACFSGGFIPALEGPDTLLITAAQADRSSFGCGTESDITWFGQAWLVDGLAGSASPIAAYDHAVGEVARRERIEGFSPSLPQIRVGARIARQLNAWLAGFRPGPSPAWPAGDRTGATAAGAPPTGD